MYNINLRKNATMSDQNIHPRVVEVGSAQVSVGLLCDIYGKYDSRLRPRLLFQQRIHSRVPA